MDAVIAVCRMCDQTKGLIKAHVIPRKFFEGIKGTDKYAVQINANKALRESGTFHQAGVYDNKILCEECERRFSDLDSYGWKVLGTPSLDDPVRDEDGNSYAYKIACDTDKLRRFLLAVLWRASVSGHEFYSRVKLGPYETVIKRRIFDPPLKPDEFPTTAMRLSVEVLGPRGDMLYQPLKERIYGLITHVLYLPPDLKFLIVTGGGNLPLAFRGFLITEPSFFYLLDCPKNLARERELFPAMVKKMRKAKGKS
jgi:hypothetical protein